MDDCHEFQKERPPKDTVVPNVETGNLERQHLPALVLPCSVGYFQIDAPYGCRRLSWDDPVERIMYGGQV
jgi:hypothetical protein